MHRPRRGDRIFAAVCTMPRPAVRVLGILTGAARKEGTLALRGDVRSLNLASILQNLASDEKTGTLTLQQKEREIHLWFEAGMVRLLGLGKGEGPSILNGLLALELISHEDLPDRAHLASPSRLT